MPEESSDSLAKLREVVGDTYDDIDDVVAYCRAIREGHTDEEARQIANGEEGTSPGSPVAGVMRRLWGWVERIFRIQRRTQSTWIDCPTCGTELIAAGAHVGQTGQLEVFRCKECGTKSEWDFDAPAPLLIHEHEAA